MTDLRKLVEGIRDFQDLVCEVREYTSFFGYTGGWEFDLSVNEAAALIELYFDRMRGHDISDPVLDTKDYLQSMETECGSDD